MNKDIIMIEGKVYLSTNSAGKLCAMSPTTIAKQCSAKKIQDCVKTNGRWYISSEEPIKFKKQKLKAILLLTLMIKNDPEVEENRVQIDNEVLRYIYNSLAMQGYLNIKNRNNNNDFNIYRDVVLTEAGFNIAIKSDTYDFDKVIVAFLNVIKPIITLIVEMSTFAT